MSGSPGDGSRRSPITPAELSALADVMLAKNIRKLSIGRIHIEMARTAAKPAVFISGPEISDADALPKEKGIGMEHGNPTDDELLFLSAPGGYDIRPGVTIQEQIDAAQEEAKQ